LIRLEVQAIQGLAECVRVLHLTDPHLFADRNGSLRGTVTYAALQKVIAHYEAGDWQAGVVALTGDLIQDDSAGAYAHCRELLSGLGLPVHCLPGNHDVRSMMRDELPSPPFIYCGSAELGNWLMVSIDSCSAGRAGGIITDDETARLQSIIAASAAEYVMVCLHHPPVLMGSTWLDSVGLENGQQFLELLQSIGRVRLTIFGHVHQPYDADHGGVRVIATPSTCRQFLPGSEKFAVDERPPAYRRITLHANGTVDAELVWVEDE
jgi:Icc protein